MYEIVSEYLQLKKYFPSGVWKRTKSSGRLFFRAGVERRSVSCVAGAEGRDTAVRLTMRSELAGPGWRVKRRIVDGGRGVYE